MAAEFDANGETKCDARPAEPDPVKTVTALHSNCAHALELARLLDVSVGEAKNRLSRLRLAGPEPAQVSLTRAAYLLAVCPGHVPVAIEKGLLTRGDDGLLALDELHTYVARREEIVRQKREAKNGDPPSAPPEDLEKSSRRTACPIPS